MTISKKVLSLIKWSLILYAVVYVAPEAVNDVLEALLMILGGALRCALEWIFEVAGDVIMEFFKGMNPFNN